MRAMPNPRYRARHPCVSISGLQEGSNETDLVFAAAAGSNGSFFLGGYTTGNWSALYEGSTDYAVVKLDSDMEVVWRLQVMARIFVEGERRRWKAWNGMRFIGGM